MTTIMYTIGVLSLILVTCIVIARLCKSTKMFTIALLSILFGIFSYMIYYSYLNENAKEPTHRVTTEVGKTSYNNILKSTVINYIEPVKDIFNISCTMLNSHAIVSKCILSGLLGQILEYNTIVTKSYPTYDHMLLTNYKGIPPRLPDISNTS